VIGPLHVFNKFYQRYGNDQIIDLAKEHKSHLFPKDDIKMYSKVESVVNSNRNFKKLNGKNINIEKACSKNQYRFDCLEEKWFIRFNFGERYSIVQSEAGMPSSSVLRVFMNQRFKKVIKDKKLDLIVPKEYLFLRSWPKNADKSDYRKYVVISEKLDVLKESETVEKINNYPSEKQEKVAEDICSLIYYAGFMDAHFNNILLTSKGIAIVDTEGISFLRASSDKERPASLVDARIAGLKELIIRTDNEVFQKVAKKYLLYARIMKVLRVATIILSVICPLIPLVVITSSLAYAAIHNIGYYFKNSTSTKNPVTQPV
jgi:hypothetical protein